MKSHGSAEKTTKWKQELRRRLAAWFRRNKREMPWRETRDPYAIWISEVMLQQTQVATVIPYFKRFLSEFPTITALAAAPEDRVLRLWEGLGYYRRARNLHRAAKKMAANFAGQFPGEFNDVCGLPGIGRYTAGAILSIAHDARLPILEANTLRLNSRLLGYRGDPRKGPGQRLLWHAAESWLPARNVGRFNQALMELGSLICTPQTPDCRRCPLATLCEANRLGLQAEIPPPARKPQVEQVHEAAVVIERRGRVLLLRRNDQGRWAGLWDFPRFAVSKTKGQPLLDELSAKVAEATGIQIEPGERLATLRHGVTRFRITLHCYSAQWLSGPDACPLKGTLKWVDPRHMDELPLSVTGRKLGLLIASGKDESLTDTPPARPLTCIRRARPPESQD